MPLPCCGVVLLWLLCASRAAAQCMQRPAQDGYSYSPACGTPLDPSNLTVDGYGAFPPGFATQGILFEGAAYHAGVVWAIPRSSNMVVAFDTRSGALTGYDAWPKGFEKPAYAFFGGVVDRFGVLWLIPCNADRVVAVNTSTGNMTGYDAWPKGFQKGGGAFIGGTVARDGVWLAPFNADRVVRVDIATGAMTGYQAWPIGYRKATSAFNSAATNGTHVWMTPFTAQIILRIDTRTGTMFKIDRWPANITNTRGWSFVGAVLINETLWVIPYGAQRVVALNTTSNTMRSYGDWPSNFTYRGAAFIGAAYDSRTLWLGPCSVDQFVGIDVATGVMTALPKAFPPGYIQQNAIGSGVVYAEDRLVLVPREGNMFLVVRPAGVPPPPAAAPTPQPSLLPQPVATAFHQSGFGFSAASADGPRLVPGHVVYTGTALSSAAGLNASAAAFQGVSCVGSTVWATPRSGGGVLEFDSTAGSLRAHATWPAKVVPQADGWLGGVVDDARRYWLVPFNADAVVAVNTSDGAMTASRAWPQDAPPALNGNSWLGGTFDGAAVWCAPFDASGVLRIDAATGRMSGYAAWPAGVVKRPRAFSGAVYDRPTGQVWLMPFDSAHFVAVDCRSGEMATSQGPWPSNVDASAGGKFVGGVLVRGVVWTVPHHAPNVVMLATDTRTLTSTKAWPAGLRKRAVTFMGAAFNGDQHLWLSPSSGTDQFVAINVNTFVMTLIAPDWPLNFSPGDSPFGGVAFTGTQLVFVPNTANMVISVAAAPSTPQPPRSRTRTLIVALAVIAGVVLCGLGVMVAAAVRVLRRRRAQLAERRAAARTSNDPVGGDVDEGGSVPAITLPRIASDVGDAEPATASDVFSTASE